MSDSSAPLPTLVERVAHSKLVQLSALVTQYEINLEIKDTILGDLQRQLKAANARVAELEGQLAYATTLEGAPKLKDYLPPFEVPAVESAEAA